MERCKRSSLIESLGFLLTNDITVGKLNRETIFSIFNRFIQEGSAPTVSDIRTHSDRNLRDAIQECKDFVQEWTLTPDIAGLMRLVLHRLGFVVYDTEDSRILYTLFEVLNSRGLEVDWLDKTKTALMSKAYELCGSPAAAEAQVESLQEHLGADLRGAR